MKRLSELTGIRTETDPLLIPDKDGGWFSQKKKKVHLFAVGDVGSFLLTGLVLMGADCIHEIGIYDVRDHVNDRFEFEMNQIRDGSGRQETVPVRSLSREELFNCDVFLFCASLRVPPLTEGGDVRMAQYEANAGLVRKTAEEAAAARYRGLFCVISDPVDPLCQVVRAAGIPASHVKGFGLGVMHARACYYAGKDLRFSSYLKEGRAYGPHGEDLVIADSLTDYHEDLSLELSRLTVTANLTMRAWGFKPYIAPALSSGAFSILAAIRGDWHYSSQALGRVFFGARNRITASGIEVENPEMPDPLFDRCQVAYEHLAELLPL